MIILFVILIILAAVILGFIVLIQNPKGGGLAGSFSGVSSQFMGVKQTNDVLEKGTWIFAAAVGILCLLSTFFTSGAGGSSDGRLQEIGTAPVQQSAPANPLGGALPPQQQQSAPANTAPSPSTADSAK